MPGLDPRLALLPLLMLAVITLDAEPARAQATGQIVGRVIESEGDEPIAAADVLIPGLRQLRTLTNERGEFVLAGVPAGTHTLRVERLGFRPVILEEVGVRAGRTTELTIEMTAAPVEVEGVTAEVERAGLIEPDVSESHEVVLGREVRELPVDNVEEVIELTTGVSDGHFRGGRVGQETYRIDGLDVKNQFEASTQGPILEVSPTALEQVEIVTGGFGAENGSALSGVVSYVTRRGDPEEWEGRIALTTDHWVPDDLFRGFTGLSTSVGGPVEFLGEGTTLFADLLAQGFVDADPRARGLTCLRPDEAGPGVAETIRGLEQDPTTSHLVCPFTDDRLPYQRGDKLIGFVRLDRPLGASTNLTVSFLHNRRQRELFTPEFKYNPIHQLGQRTRGNLLNVTLDWTRHRQGRAYHVTVRGAALLMDRYLGVVDPWTFDGRVRLGGFGFGDFRFVGEDFVRRPIERQLATGNAVPGYIRPGGSTGSPFGPAAEGIFFTEGTPQIANWSSSDFLGGDVVAEMHTADGHSFRAGASGRFYRSESYERTLAFLPGSAPTYARFYPATADGFAQVSLAAADQVTVNLGVRLEAFKAGLRFQRDRLDFLAPLVDTGWQANVMPRVGVAVPIPQSEGRTMFRFNFGMVSQPPDFQFFLDTTLGDSLRVDIRRQGNPDLTFERGIAYEAGLTHVLDEHISLSATAFLKDLTNLVTGSLGFSGFAPNQFTTGDFGTVKGLEALVRGRWPGIRVRAGYALQEAKGVTSGALDDPGSEIEAERREFPLAFDRRHTADLTVVLGRPAGDFDSPWAAALTASVRSGFPLDRRLAAEAIPGEPTVPTRLPWTWLVDLRAARDLGRPPLCGSCRWRVIADLRNLFGRDNIVALRRDTGTLAPTSETIESAALDVPDDMEPIPMESPRYSQQIDLNGDGLITVSEFRTARVAATLDRNDPSLFFGSARELRLGLEVTF